MNATRPRNLAIPSPGDYGSRTEAPVLCHRHDRATTHLRVLLIALALLSPAVADEEAPPAVFVTRPVPRVQHGGMAPRIDPEVRPGGKAPRKGGVATWTENGENGTAAVTDATSAAYGLLQSDQVAEGSYAFHLAGGARDWFAIAQTIRPQADTKLFFLLRLSWATADQIVRVQVSTDSGSNWTQSIFSRAGTGDAGDGTFLLEEVSLAAFAGQEIRLRFLYDRVGGSYFPQTDNDVGAFIDSIQIGASLQKQLYSIGNPTDDEQLYLEYINRARSDAAAEAARLANESDPVITNAYGSIDTNDILAQFGHHVSSGCMAAQAQPLAFNEKLLQIARLHSQDMFTGSFQGHVSSASPPAPLQAGDTLGLRASRVGYGFTALGENVYANARSVAHGHAGFDVDWGTKVDAAKPCYHAPFAGQGMQNPPGHRLSIHNNTFKEIGVGVVNGSNGGVGPQIVTQDFGTSGGTFLTGVVFDDRNGNQFCDGGEGVGGVRVDVDGVGFHAVSSDSGGYAVPVDGDGSWTISFSGGGWQDWQTQVVVSGGLNRKVDYIVQPAPMDYPTWATAGGITGGPDGDHDGDSVRNLVEFALAHLDASVSDAYQFPVPVYENNGITLTVDRNTAAGGVSIGAESSTDLVNWTAGGFTVLTNTSQVYSIHLPAGGPVAFVRIVVTMTP